jgi:hypothetical protein
MASIRARLDRLTKQVEPLNSICHTDHRQILLDKLSSLSDRCRNQPGYIEPEDIEECRQSVGDYLAHRFGKRNWGLQEISEVDSGTTHEQVQNQPSG